MLPDSLASSRQRLILEAIGSSTVAASFLIDLFFFLVGVTGVDGDADFRFFFGEGVDSLEHI